MRSIIALQVLLALAAAAPAPIPQDIDFSLASALPNPTFTIAGLGVTAQTVSYNPTSILSSVAAQVTSAAVATSTLDTDNDLLVTSDAPDKRDLAKRTACTPLPAGVTGYPFSPDTPTGFLSNPAFAAAASAAPLPSGYTQVFTDLQASNSALGYLGYTYLTSYDTLSCASQCNAINGCLSFNIYFERDPSVDPGSGATGCENPSSVTMVRCVWWGGPIDAGNANNEGGTYNQFQQVVTGSNGYMNNSLVPLPGYNEPVDLGNAAINAPYDANGFDSYMGSQLFNSGPFNASLCAEACTMQSEYNLAHPPTDGSPVQTCQFFNTYILYIDTTANLQGQYCALYSESWDSSYATNAGQWYGNDHYLIEYSYSYSNSTNSGTLNPTAAVYQASKDISWATLQPFCSSYLGYSAPLSTATVVTTATAVVTSGATTTTTTMTAAANQKRTLSTPDVLTKYPTAILSSACSLQATPATVTSYTTTSTTSFVATTFTPSTTVVVTATDIPAPSNFWLYNGASYVTVDILNENLEFNSFEYAAVFSINSNGNLVCGSNDLPITYTYDPDVVDDNTWAVIYQSRGTVPAGSSDLACQDNNGYLQCIQPDNDYQSLYLCGNRLAIGKSTTDNCAPVSLQMVSTSLF